MSRKSSAADPDQYLRTTEVRAHLGARSMRSGFVMLAARPLQVALEIGSVMVLARLLTPDDFGLRAMVFPLTVLVTGLANLGLQTAVIQRESLDHRQLSALFWIALKVNTILILFMALAAPVLASFYRDPRVTAITLVLAVSLFIQSLSAFQAALLQRQMRFGVVTSIYLGSLIAGVVVAIGSALLGAGYWALVLQVLTIDVTRSAATWTACRWRPSPPDRSSVAADLGIRAMLSYGANLTGSRVISWLGRQLDRVVVGYVGGAGMLGLYHVARRWAWFPFQQLYLALTGVAVSALSRVQDDPERFRGYYRKGLLPVLSVGMPAVAFVFVEARDVVLVLLGDQWLGAVLFLRLMCIAAFFGSTTPMTRWLYLSQGQTKRQLRWDLIYTSATIAALVVGARWGVMGVAVGFALSRIALAFPSVAYCLRESPITMADLIHTTWRPLLASTASATIALFGSGVLLGHNEIMTRLLLKLSAFGVLYMFFWAVLPGGTGAAREVLGAISRLRARPLDAHAATYLSAAAEE